MGNKRRKKGEIFDKSPTLWRCIICSTENELKTFESDNDLLFHHMSHSILELAQALNEIQSFLQTVNMLECLRLPKKVSSPKEVKSIRQSTEDVSVDEISTEIEPKPEIPKEIKETKNLVKKFECDSCGKVLSSRGNLNKHMILHDPSKKFECSLCDAKFNQVRFDDLKMSSSDLT